MSLPILVDPVYNPVKLKIGTKASRSLYSPFFLTCSLSFSFFSANSPDKQSCGQRRLPSGQHQLPKGPVPGSPVHYHWNWHLRGCGCRPHCLPLQKQPPVSFPKAGMKEGEPSQLCEGREETPVCYCTVQVIAKRLHNALESSTPGLVLFLSFNFIFSTVQSTRQPAMLILPPWKFQRFHPSG